MIRAVFAALLLLLLSAAPAALAVPGQYINTPWGGFCDGLPAADGSFPLAGLANLLR